MMKMKWKIVYDTAKKGISKVNTPVKTSSIVVDERSIQVLLAE